MEIAVWILAGLAALYLVVRFGLAWLMRQPVAEESDADLPIDQPRP
jgi:hypothetical protein